jgi:hypothetical protein
MSVRVGPNNVYLHFLRTSPYYGVPLQAAYCGLYRSVEMAGQVMPLGQMMPMFLLQRMAFAEGNTGDISWYLCLFAPICPFVKLCRLRNG